MSRRSLVSLLIILAVAGGLLAASLVAGNSPLLGLDLKGGVEVVLVPVDDPERPEDITAGDLDTAVNIIRDRIDGLGVAEPDVTRQGGRVVVQLPGISDQQRAIDLVGQTAELRFRPVCAELSAEPIVVAPEAVEVTPGDVEVVPEVVEVTPGDVEVTPGDVEVVPGDVEVVPEVVEVTPGEEAGLEDEVLGDETLPEAPEDEGLLEDSGLPEDLGAEDEVLQDEVSIGEAPSEVGGFVNTAYVAEAVAAQSQAPEEVDVVEPAEVEEVDVVEPVEVEEVDVVEPVEVIDVTDVVEEGDVEEEADIANEVDVVQDSEDAITPEVVVEQPELPVAELDERGLAPCPADTGAFFGLPTSTSAEDQLDSFVVLPQRDDDGQVVRRYLLGPSSLTGAGLSGADSAFTNEYVVIANFKGGDEGSDQFDELAAECFSGSPICPGGRGRVAIVVDGTVEVAPSVNADSFDGEAVISGGYSGDEAEDLALVLRYGALPVEFQDPTDSQSDSTSRAVSATIGSDSLRAGVIAGIVGLALVFLYMMVMYRLLGVIAMLSLGVSATLLWVIVAWLGETQDLALTLAGVTGLIVAIGVSLDSNVVYFEHLKEDVATGRSLRSSLEQSFRAAFITIFRANFASLIAAVILYWLSAGSVRGFALMLGLASVLDLVATYFFLRPCAQLLSRFRTLMEHPHRLGLPTPEEAIAQKASQL